MRTTIFILLASAAFLSSEVLAQKAVDYRELGKDVAIIGQLGVPLGTVVQIDATVVAGRSLGSKDLASEYLLKVLKVGSTSVSNVPACQFQTHSWADVKLAPDVFSLYELKKGKKTGSLSDSQIAELESGYVGQHFHLLVYEEGIYTGVPRDLPKDYPIWQDRAFGFRTHLIVLRIMEDSGKPNQQGGANGRQPSSPETNRTSAAAASRRSP
jgi:hypothetical protein